MKRQAEGEIMDIPAEAEAYAQADFADVNQAFVDRLLELAAGMDNIRALDLGTGPADIPVRLLKTLRARSGAAGKASWRITAVDGSRPMLEHAAKLVEQAGMADDIILRYADAKNTGLPAKSFDVVFSNSILHHLTETAAFWAEIKRVAKPAAVIFLRDLARPADEQEARRIVDKYAGTASNILWDEYFRSLLAAYTVDEVRRQLAQAGLSPQLSVRMATDRHLDVWGRLNAGQ
ncbi:MAG: class I SAM-dependent methyltransferase [Phycisphaerae bacterium]